MGQFSWMYADTGNKKALRCGKRAFVPCPNGITLIEAHYDGYGNFEGHDIYELVADWNREYISKHNIRRPLRRQWGDTKGDDALYKSAVDRYCRYCQRITDFVNKKSDEYMTETYGREWKRSIGIDIACYDDENEALKFPIKICMYPSQYDSVPASKRDPNQGWL